MKAGESFGLNVVILDDDDGAGSRGRNFPINIRPPWQEIALSLAGHPPLCPIDGEIVPAISDLVRSRTGLMLAILGTTFLARSRVARVDGPLSVRAARTPAEYRLLAARAGLPHATVRRTWPERVVLAWKTAEPVAELLPGVACA